MEKEAYPMRLNKYMALQGLCSRREADQLIEKKRVFVNGKLATLGQKVTETDTVELHRGHIKNYEYVAYYKPRGVVTHSPQEEEIDIQTKLGRKNLFPVGRLDKESEGLIILTNDGRVTTKVLSEEKEYEKEYVVEVDAPLRKSIPEIFARGIDIENYTTKPAKAVILSKQRLSITLTEGKKHQIRRMLAALGYRVTKLTRVRIGNIRLQNLKPNGTLPLDAKVFDL